MRCSWPVFLSGAWRISPKLYGEQKYITNLNKKAYEHIETWRTRPLSGDYPYVYVDGVYLKRSWGGEIQNVSVLIDIALVRMAVGKFLALRKG